MLVARLFDVVTDPMMGALADRTRSRWGTYRPWMIIGAVPLGVVFALMLYTPDLGAVGKHIMEPYTNLLRVWNDEELAERLHTLLHIFTKKLFNTETHHLGLFFDDAWKPLDKGIESYGHDIEASWLMDEAAAVLGCGPTNESLLIGMAAADGLQDDGSMIHEACPATGTIDDDRVWWVQCENIIGQYNLFQRTGDDRYRQYAERCWDYTCQHLIDTVEGEWFWSIRGDGTVNRNDDKAGLWKCPYHNTRLCIEMMERIGNK